MLEESLANLFEVQLTPELYKLYMDAILYLEGIEYDTIQDELVNIMFTPLLYDDDYEDKSESNIVDQIGTYLTRAFRMQLSNSGIELEEQAHLSYMLELSTTLGLVTQHEDTDTIIGICTSYDSPEGKLSEILQILGSTCSEEWLTQIVSVSKEVLSNIVFVLTDGVKNTHQFIEPDTKYLPKLRYYLGFCQATFPELEVFNMATSTVLGRPLSFYIESAGKLQQLFEGNEMERLARELYGMTILSSDGADPTNAISSLIENYVHDTPRIVSVNRYVSEINAAFVKYYHENSKGVVDHG